MPVVMLPTFDLCTSCMLIPTFYFNVCLSYSRAYLFSGCQGPGAPNDCFLSNICVEFSFALIRTAKNI